MYKKQILTLHLIAFCSFTIAQKELKLKLDSIAKSGLEKGIHRSFNISSRRNKVCSSEFMC